MQYKSIFLPLCFFVPMHNTFAANDKHKPHSHPLVKFAKRHIQALRPKLIESALTQAHIPGGSRAQFFKDFEASKARQSIASSPDTALRKAILSSYITEWLRQHSATPLATPMPVVLQHRNDLEAKVQCAIAPVTALSQLKQKALMTALSSLPEALIALIQQYALDDPSSFIPMIAQILRGRRYEDGDRLFRCSLFDISADGFLEEIDLYINKDEVSSRSRYPHSWTPQISLVTEKFGSCSISNAEQYLYTDPVEQANDQHFRALCGTDIHTLDTLIRFLTMRAKHVPIDSAEYRKGIHHSLTMLNPNSLTLHTFAAQIKHIYAQVTKLVTKPEFKQFDEIIYHSSIRAFIKAYQNSSIIRLFEETESGATSVLLFNFDNNLA